MSTREELKLMSDDELLGSLSEVARKAHVVEADLIAHIAEVDRRRLYELGRARRMPAHCCPDS